MHDGACWRACNKEHIEAAERVIEEASKVMWRWRMVNSKAAVNELLRLATLEPEMRQAVKLGEAGLGEKGWRQ